MSDTTTEKREQLEEQRARLEEAGVSTDALEEELADLDSRDERESKLLDWLIQLEEAKEAGLEDAPAAQAIREKVRDLEAELYGGPRTELAREANLSRATVNSLDEDEAEQALTHLRAIEALETASAEHSVIERSLDEHRTGLEQVLGHRTDAAAVEEAFLSDATNDDVVASGEAGAAKRAEAVEAADAADDDGETDFHAELAERLDLSDSELDRFSRSEASRAADLHADAMAFKDAGDERLQERSHESAEELTQLLWNKGIDPESV